MLTFSVQILFGLLVLCVFYQPSEQFKFFSRKTPSQPPVPMRPIPQRPIPVHSRQRPLQSRQQPLSSGTSSSDIYRSISEPSLSGRNSPPSLRGRNSPPSLTGRNSQEMHEIHLQAASALNTGAINTPQRSHSLMGRVRYNPEKFDVYRKYLKEIAIYTAGVGGAIAIAKSFSSDCEKNGNEKKCDEINMNIPPIVPIKTSEITNPIGNWPIAERRLPNFSFLNDTIFHTTTMASTHINKNASEHGVEKNKNKETQTTTTAMTEAAAVSSSKYASTYKNPLIEMDATAAMEVAETVTETTTETITKAIATVESSSKYIYSNRRYKNPLIVMHTTKPTAAATNAIPPRAMRRRIGKGGETAKATEPRNMKQTTATGPTIKKITIAAPSVTRAIMDTTTNKPNVIPNAFSNAFSNADEKNALYNISMREKVTTTKRPTSTTRITTEKDEIVNRIGNINLEIDDF